MKTSNDTREGMKNKREGITHTRNGMTHTHNGMRYTSVGMKFMRNWTLNTRRRMMCTGFGVRGELEKITDNRRQITEIFGIQSGKP